MRKIYLLALGTGIAVEFLGFEFEQWMILQNIPANTGFWVSFYIFIFSPFLSTGIIVYKYTKEILKALILSASVIPATILILRILKL